MNRPHIEEMGYYDLEFLCEFENFECVEFWKILNRFELNEISYDEYLKLINELEFKIRDERPELFNVGGLMF
jgi:hypothetical protein